MKHYFKAFIATAFAAILFCGCPAKISISCDKNGRYIATCTPHFSSEFIANLSKIMENSAEFAQFDSNSVDFSRLNSEYSDIIPEEFISTKKLSSGKTQFAIKISRESIQNFLSQQNDSRLSTVFESSMAPLVSGEQMTKDEYRELLEEVYGTQVADEILDGAITVEFTSPAGKKFLRQLAVADLLVSTAPVTIVFEY